MAKVQHYGDLVQILRTCIIAQKPDLKTIESYDVSFTEIRSEDKWSETVQKVATAISVEFTDSSKQLPFVPFTDFDLIVIFYIHSIPRAKPHH